MAHADPLYMWHTRAWGADGEYLEACFYIGPELTLEQQTQAEVDSRKMREPKR
jgi:hypothetical protein